MLNVRKVEAGKIAGSLTYVLSDDTLDRYGDIIDPAGWDLKWFRKNPIALFGHNSSFPIGTWKNVRVEGGKLMAELDPAQRGTSARVDEILSLIEQDVLRATSVGFRPIEYEPIDEKHPYGGQRYTKMELLEASIVSVPANPAALHVAKSLRVSEETMSLVFGEQAGIRRRDATSPGGNAVKPPVIGRSTAMSVKTLSQRIEDAQNDLNAKRDTLTELTNADEIDNDAAEEVTAQVDAAERTLATLKAAEAKIGTNAGGAVKPGGTRRPLGVALRDVKPSDLIVRAAVCNLLAHIGNKSIDDVLEERYPGHEATAVVTKTAIAVATTTTSGWASQLVETAMGEFLALLPPTAIYPVLREMGVALTFGPNAGNIKIPFSSSSAALAGGFVLEGDPIPVGRMTLDSVTLTPTKFGIIVPMTKEVMRYTNPTLESVVRSELLARTTITLDGLLIDATVGSVTRPAGLLYGLSVAGSAYGGGDYLAFLADIKALLAPFDTANAGRKLAILMNPQQARNIRMMAGPNSSGFGWANQFLADYRIIVSTVVTAGTIIAVDTADFVTSTGDAPEFETSDQATIHMESSPAPLSATGSPNTVAAPIRSMFQTNSVALKMVMNVNWAMRRTGMVQYMSGVSW